MNSLQCFMFNNQASLISLSSRMTERASIKPRLFRSRHDRRSERASSLAYFALVTSKGAKQRVPVTWIYPDKQRVTMPDRIRSLRALAKTDHDAGAQYKAFWMRQRLRRNTRMARWGLRTPLPKTNARTPQIHQRPTMRTYANRKSMMRLCPDHVCHLSSLPGR
jgi:hypothetical protein